MTRDDLRAKKSFSKASSLNRKKTGLSFKLIKYSQPLYHLMLYFYLKSCVYTNESFYLQSFLKFSCAKPFSGTYPTHLLSGNCTRKKLKFIKNSKLTFHVFRSQKITYWLYVLIFWCKITTSKKYKKAQLFSPQKCSSWQAWCD